MWIKTHNGELTLQPEVGAPVRIIVDRATDSPIVVVGTQTHHPTKWEGPAGRGPGVSKWTFSTGPLFELLVWRDCSATYWVTPSWR